MEKVTKIYFTKAEVDALKEFCDDNLAVGTVEVIQDHSGGIGYCTKVQVTNLPETLLNITDIDSW